MPSISLATLVLLLPHACLALPFPGQGKDPNQPDSSKPHRSGPMSELLGLNSNQPPVRPSSSTGSFSARVPSAVHKSGSSSSLLPAEPSPRSPQTHAAQNVQASDLTAPHPRASDQILASAATSTHPKSVPPVRGGSTPRLEPMASPFAAQANEPLHKAPHARPRQPNPVPPSNPHPSVQDIDRLFANAHVTPPMGQHVPPGYFSAERLQAAAFPTNHPLASPRYTDHTMLAMHANAHQAGMHAMQQHATQADHARLMEAVHAEVARRAATGPPNTMQFLGAHPGMTANLPLHNTEGMHPAALGANIRHLDDQSVHEHAFNCGRTGAAATERCQNHAMNRQRYGELAEVHGRYPPEPGMGVMHRNAIVGHYEGLRDYHRTQEAYQRQQSIDFGNQKAHAEMELASRQARRTKDGFGRAYSQGWGKPASRFRVP